MWSKNTFYINEIIRINYKCNWSCKFCNVLKTNNYWTQDIPEKEVIYKILSLLKKYTKMEMKGLILSFSWWEPTLNKKLGNYIKLAKSIWIWTVEIQTNWSILFINKWLIDYYIKMWLDEVFLAQHSHLNEINNKLWVKYSIIDFLDWVKYLKSNWIHKKISLNLNIVISKINIDFIGDYLFFLMKSWFINLIRPKKFNIWFWGNSNLRKISIWFVQPNWYANIYKEEVLLNFTNSDLDKIDKIIFICMKNKIFPDFHFTSPPLCILDYPEYNLEYNRLKKIEEDEKKWKINIWNLKSYQILWKEKVKFNLCSRCKNDRYCKWFYKNWLLFVWKKYVQNKINAYID